MSVYDITEVQMSSDGNSFIYEVYAENTMPSANIILSKSSNPEDKTSYIQCAGSWSKGSDFGRCTVNRSDLDIKTDYFMFLEYNGEKSDVVRVFSSFPVLRSYSHLEYGKVALNFDRDENYLSASEIRIDAPGAPVRLALPENTVNLSECKIEKGASVMKLYFYMKSGKADINSAYSEIQVLIDGPIFEKAEFKNAVLNFSGSFDPAFDIYAQLWLSRTMILESKLVSGKFDLKDVLIDSNNLYEVRLYYGNKYGRSFYGNYGPLVNEKAEVDDISYDGKSSYNLRLRRSGVYEYSDTDGKHIISGDMITLPSSVEVSVLRKVLNNSYGPEITVKISKKAFYSFEKNGKIFYLQGEKPSVPSKDITAALSIKLTPYSGKYFTLKDSSSGVSDIVITMSALDDQRAEVYSDYETMLKTSVKTYSDLKEITDVLTSVMPMRKEDMLFYRYQNKPENASVGIHPGMMLSAEFALYQNIPDKAADYDNGYAGTGMSEYMVILNKTNITFEPFINGMINPNKAFTVPAPPPITTTCKAYGGSGLCDLLFDGFFAPFVKLVYPQKYTERNKAGSSRYYDNICLISAHSVNDLEDAVTKMRQSALISNSAAYTTFRGRAVVVPKIQILSGKIPYRISVGTTLGDFISSLCISDINAVRLKRCGLPIYFSAADNKYDFPLIGGDIVEGL